MLKTERMTRVLVMGTMDSIGETVNYLYESRQFHVIDFMKDEVHDIGSPLEGANEASAKLLKMMSISSSLDAEEPDTPEAERVSIEKIHHELDPAITHMELEISAANHARKEVDDLLAKKRNTLASLQPFIQIDFPLDLLTDRTSVTVLSGRLKGDVSAELDAITDSYDIIQSQDICIVIVSKQYAEQALKVLAGHGFVEAKMPSIKETPAAAIGRLNAEIRELEGRLEEAKDRLEKLKTANSQFIAAALEELTIEANKAETPLRFGTARFTFLIDAWVPTRSFEALKSDLENIGSGAVDMVAIGTESGDEPPIRLSNPKLVAPMQMLMEMFSLPTYDEIDPTMFMFITFPLFYGMILGDMGYGIVLALLVLTGGLTWIMTKLGMAGGAPGLNKIILYCSVTSVIFGFVFDEFFGFEVLHHYGFHYSILGIEFPVYRGEVEMVGPMLILCICIGVAHLMLGFIAGFRNVWVKHGLKHAILEKGGWCMILAGFTLFAFSAVPKLISGAGLQFTDPQSLFGLALLAAGVAMAFSVEGINAILELPSLSGNLLSYTRIYAIGLSSIGIAMAFNTYMAMPAIEAGGIWVILGVAVLIGGHAMNLGLGLIGPLIQTLRLHYVEFFTKFYKGGGIRFNPLKYRRKHTKEV